MRRLLTILFVVLFLFGSYILGKTAYVMSEAYKRESESKDSTIVKLRQQNDSLKQIK